MSGVGAAFVIVAVALVVVSKKAADEAALSPLDAAATASRGVEDAWMGLGVGVVSVVASAGTATPSADPKLPDDAGAPDAPADADTPDSAAADPSATGDAGSPAPDAGAPPIAAVSPPPAKPKAPALPKKPPVKPKPKKR